MSAHKGGGPGALGRFSRPPAAPAKNVRRVTPLWPAIKSFLVGYPMHILIFCGVVIWEYREYKDRELRYRYDKWLQYQFLEAREVGRAEEIRYVPYEQQKETAPSSGDAIHYVDYFGSSPQDDAATAHAVQVPPERPAEPTRAPVPPPPVSLAEAVPIILTADQKKELKRRRKEEALDALREADILRSEPLREYRSPKEIYARELAVFEPRKYKLWMAMEKRRLNAKKRARMAITPRKLKKNPNAQAQRAMQEKLRNSVAGINSVVRKSHEFHRDAQLAVLIEQQERQLRAQERIAERQKALEEEGALTKPRQQPLPMKDREKVSDAARARFQPTGNPDK